MDGSVQPSHPVLLTDPAPSVLIQDGHIAIGQGRAQLKLPPEVAVAHALTLLDAAAQVMAGVRPMPGRDP